MRKTQAGSSAQIVFREFCAGCILYVRRPRGSELRGGHRKKSCDRGIAFKNDMPDAGIPNTEQNSFVVAGDHDETLRFRLEQQKVFRPRAIHDNDAVDLQIRAVDEHNVVRAVFLQKIRQRGSVSSIAKRYLYGGHRWC